MRNDNAKNKAKGYVSRQRRAPLIEREPFRGPTKPEIVVMKAMAKCGDSVPTIRVHFSGRYTSEQIDKAVLI